MNEIIIKSILIQKWTSSRLLLFKSGYWEGQSLIVQMVIYTSDVKNVSRDINILTLKYTHREAKRLYHRNLMSDCPQTNL